MPDMEQKVTFTSQTQDTTFLECVKKAAVLTHTLYVGNIKSQQANDAITIPDKDLKWSVLQGYLRGYKSFINSLTPLSGIYVFDVDANFYACATESQLNKQLEIVTGFVYLKEALHSAKNETYKSCLKKLLKHTGLFSDKQLSIL